jgi:hypothetical protein
MRCFYLLIALCCVLPAVAQTIEQETLPSLAEGLEINGLTTQNRSIEVIDAGGNLVLENTLSDDVQEVTTGEGAVLRGLDRVSADLVDFELASGEGVLFGPLLITLKECRYPIENPAGDAFAYLTIEDRLLGSLVFEGWMIGSSPALNALDHSRYDVWALRCKTSEAEPIAPAE